MEDMFRVGVISSMHGVRGEVKVYPTTDDINRFEELEDVILDNGNKKTVLEIESVKFFKNQVILKFKGYDNRNEVEAFRGKDLYVTRENAVPLGEDEYFISDIIGFKVADEEGNAIGVLSDVMKTGANDVFVITTTGEKELLIPYIDECVKLIDTEKGHITIHMLKGL